MIDMSDVLQTLAEVSIAYVGFSAIFGVLSSRAEAWPSEVRVMFRALIEVGLVVLLMCVAPLAIAPFGFAGDLLWQIASAFAVVVGIALSAWRFHMVRTHLNAFPREAPVFFMVSISTLVVMVLNAAVWQAAGPYLVSVCLSLVAASAIFLAMIYRMFPLSHPGARDADADR